MKNKAYLLSVIFGMRYFFLFFLGFSLVSFMPPADTIEITIAGNELSPHYARPLMATFTNSTAEAQTVEWQVGSLFASDDENVQDMVLTQPLMVALAPGEEKEVKLYAMCIQQSNRAPDWEDTYTLDGMAEGHLYEMAGLAHRHEMHNFSMQSWVWRAANHAFPSKIDSFALTDSSSLVGYIDGRDTLFDIGYNAPGVGQTFNGSFTMRFERVFDVHIAIFNDRDIAVREIYKNPETPVGETEIEFSFVQSDLEPGSYNLRLIADGNIMMQKGFSIN